MVWNKGLKYELPSKRKGQYKVCSRCKTLFYCHPSEVGKRLYCSTSCSNKTNAKKLSQDRQGKGNPMYGKKSWNTGLRYKLPPEKKGKNHFNYKGRNYNEGYRLRRTKDWQEWRRKVYERDNYCCQIDNEKSDTLEPHHKYLFSIFKEKRFEVSNGITLCRKHHKLLHNMSYKNKMNCPECNKKDKVKIEMEPVIVGLLMTVYRCPKCNYELTISYKEGDKL